MRTKAELLNDLDNNTHTLYNPAFLAEVNKVFGTSIEARKYPVDGGHNNPKGLYADDGKSTTLVGIAAFHLAPALCSALGVKYEDKLGRGFQVRACTQALRKAGYERA